MTYGRRNIIRIAQAPACHGSGSRAATRRGMTLAEVLMALLITTLIATTVTAALVAATYGTSSRRDWRRLTVKEYKIRSQLQDAICSARALLASGDSADGHYLVLWKGESAAADDTVNLSELQLIAWVESTASLSSFEAALVPSPDTEYDADANFYQAASQAAQGGTLAETVWSNDVTGFDVTGDAAGSQAGMVTWTMQLQEGAFEKTLVGLATLRAPDPPE